MRAIGSLMMMRAWRKGKPKSLTYRIGRVLYHA